MAEKLFFEVIKCISKFEAVNDNLTKAKCYVMALGTNQNKTHFEKETVDKAFETLGFIPVVGHLIKGEDGKHYLGGHDYAFDKETLEFESLCEPFGVVLPSESPTYELVTEDDGTENTYLTCDVILWTGRYPALKEAVYSDNIMFNQSMEIYVDNSEPLAEDEDITNVLNFRFDALCMLNKSDDVSLNVEPCFPNASIVSEYSKDSEVFTAFFRDIKEQLRGYFMDKTENFAATYGQKRDAVAEVLAAMNNRQEDDKGAVISYVNYWLMDLDDEHCFVSKEEYERGEYKTSHFRVGYAFGEDNKVQLVGDPEAITSVWVTADEKAKLDERVTASESAANAAREELASYQESHSHTNEEYDDLVAFKADALEKKRQAEIDAVFSKYDEVLGDAEDYIALKENYGEATAEQVNDSCLRMVGTYSMKKRVDSGKREDYARTPAASHEDEPQPYGGFIDNYTTSK